MPNHELLLATESHYKIRLLKRLLVPFRTESARIDESPLPGESVPELTKRLAKEKATILSDQYPHHTVLASDQSAGIGGQILHKPGTFDRAVLTLREMSGQSITFYVSAALIYQGIIKCHTEKVIIKLRSLEESEISRYVEKDQPLDCVGAFKIESLGISLFEWVESRDPTALEGLPLIQIAQWFRDIGLITP